MNDTDTFPPAWLAEALANYRPRAAEYAEQRARLTAASSGPCQGEIRRHAAGRLVVCVSDHVPLPCGEEGIQVALVDSTPELAGGDALIVPQGLVTPYALVVRHRTTVARGDLGPEVLGLLPDEVIAAYLRRSTPPAPCAWAAPYRFRDARWYRSEAEASVAQLLTPMDCLWRECEHVLGLR